MDVYIFRQEEKRKKKDERKIVLHSAVVQRTLHKRRVTLSRVSFELNMQICTTETVYVHRKELLSPRCLLNVAPKVNTVNIFTQFKRKLSLLTVYKVQLKIKSTTST